MEFKIVGRQNASENQENVTESIRQSDIPQQESQVIHSEIRYENPKLIRRDGVYYIGYENDLILIEEWEAEEVYLHPERVYDVIISHRRKYYFNAAEDSINRLLDKPLPEESD